MSADNLFVISKSDRPVGLYRLTAAQELPIVISTVPLECVQAKLDRIIAENRVHQKDLGSGNVLGYIQDGIAALDIIEHALFLYVETPMTFSEFLLRYGDVAEMCPACHEEIEYLDPHERLEHIIRCKWKHTRTVLASIMRGMSNPRMLQ